MMHDDAGRRVGAVEHPAYGDVGDHSTRKPTGSDPLPLYP